MRSSYNVVTKKISKKTALCRLALYLTLNQPDTSLTFMNFNFPLYNYNPKETVKKHMYRVVNILALDNSYIYRDANN